MVKIGILAYGSLIEDPGDELSSLIIERIKNVETPFNIEFARKSSTRDAAPTVIPVEKGGCSVMATILVLKEGTTINEAEDFLWRRETRNEGSEKHYKRPEKLNQNKVIVESISDFEEIDCVLYTKIGPNIPDRNAKQLAMLAINSAKSTSGKLGKDGINYLLSLKRQGVKTALMDEYEKEILKQTSTNSLQDAIAVCSGKILS
jgi:cation transport regulator ChaC